MLALRVHIETRHFNKWVASRKVATLSKALVIRKSYEIIFLNRIVAKRGSYHKKSFKGEHKKLGFFWFLTIMFLSRSAIEASTVKSRE